MSKHTPGPWFVDGLIVSAAGKGSVGFAYGPSFAERSEVGRESLANARLIAVAPELLEALQMLLSYTLSCEALLNATPAGQIEVARAAIAKATGDAA